MDKAKLIERKREYMCAHYPLCRGCPIDNAARKVKLNCHVFRKKKPDEMEKIVLQWEREHCPPPVL